MNPNHDSPVLTADLARALDGLAAAYQARYVLEAAAVYGFDIPKRLDDCGVALDLDEYAADDSDVWVGYYAGLADGVRAALAHLTGEMTDDAEDVIAGLPRVWFDPALTPFTSDNAVGLARIYAAGAIGKPTDLVLALNLTDEATVDLAVLLLREGVTQVLALHAAATMTAAQAETVTQLLAERTIGGETPDRLVHTAFVL